MPYERHALIWLLVLDQERAQVELADHACRVLLAQHREPAVGGMPERRFRGFGIAELVLDHAELVPRIQRLRVALAEHPRMACDRVAALRECRLVVTIELQCGCQLQLQAKGALRIDTKRLARLR